MMERGEAAIVGVQFFALAVVVLLLSNFSPAQTGQSSPVISSTYWGTSVQGTLLHQGQITKVNQNASVLSVYFAVAYSTKVSAVSGSRICAAPNSTTGVATTYTTIPYVFDSTKGTGTVSLSPVGQETGWVCTYTVKITDNLSQTVTWLGSVELP